MLYSIHSLVYEAYTSFSKLGLFIIMNTNLRYLLVIILFAIGGALVGESIISGANAIQIVLGVILLIGAIVVLLQVPVKR